MQSVFDVVKYPMPSSHFSFSGFWAIDMGVSEHFRRWLGKKVFGVVNFKCHVSVTLSSVLSLL